MDLHARAFPSEMMSLLSPLPCCLSFTSELSRPLKCPSLVLEKALDSWQGERPPLGVGAWKRCLENQPVTVPACDFWEVWRESRRTAGDRSSHSQQPQPSSHELLMVYPISGNVYMFLKRKKKKVRGKFIFFSHYNRISRCLENREVKKLMYLEKGGVFKSFS